MKRKIIMLSAASLFLLAMVFGLPLSDSPLAHINNISIQPGMFNTKVILQSSGPLAVTSAGFASENPRIMVMNLDRVGNISPIQSASDPQVLERIETVKLSADRARVLFHLKEKLPYRIYSEQNRTVVELTKIRNGDAPYVIDEELRNELAQKTTPNQIMKTLDISSEAEKITFNTRTEGPVLSQVFVLDQPLRLVVDLFGTVYSGGTSVFPVEKMGLEKVRVGQFQMADPCPITRMVFDLNEPKQYAVSNTSKGMSISFYKNHSLPLAAPAANLSAEKTAPVQALPDLSKADPVLEIKPLPVQTLKTEEVKAAPKTEPPPPAPAKPHPVQTEMNKPPEAKDQDSKNQQEKYKPKTIVDTETRYSGNLVTLRFKDADLRDVILSIGMEAGLNVIFDPEVKGVITCNLEQVPWDQALDLLLRNNKLGRVIEGNVLRVAPMTILTREDEEQRKLRESKEMAGPVIVKTVTLSYSKAKDVKTLLETKKSNRGVIDIDDRTNTLIISDVKDKLELLEKLISVLDTPTPQVSIEARIVEATATFVRNLGIQWGYRGIADPFYGNQTTLQFPNKILVDGGMIPQGQVTKGIGGPLGGYAVNLPAPAFSALSGFSLANVLDTFRLDVALTALETSGEGKVISLPKITTQNNQQAEIIQGRQIPIQTVANFTVTTRFQNAALELRATPQITAEGTVIMTLDIQNNAPDFSNLVNGIPPITMQSAKTTVMVPDGGTTVIGGIYRTEDSVTRERVPFFYKIPIIGSLFRNFARTKQNRELLIFITPRIIK